MAELTYLGKGESYPYDSNSVGGVKLVSDKELIRQSILDILSTPKGTIFNLEEYGSLLYRLTFTPNDEVLKSLIVYTVSKSLFDWEKRIRVIDISSESVNEVQLNCTITYKILASNEVDAFVYPFYKELKS